MVDMLSRSSRASSDDEGGEGGEGVTKKMDGVAVDGEKTPHGLEDA